MVLFEVVEEQSIGFEYLPCLGQEHHLCITCPHSLDHVGVVVLLQFFRTPDTKSVPGSISGATRPMMRAISSSLALGCLRSHHNTRVVA